jgi:outer membrane protein OmpA-like peptidoglycan-associated protein
MNRMLMIALLGVMGCGGGRGEPAKSADDTPAAAEPAGGTAALPEAKTKESEAAATQPQQDTGDAEPAGTGPAAAETDKDAPVDPPAVVEAPSPPSAPLAATQTESVLRITVVTDKGEVIPGVIVTVENSKGQKYISQESDANGLVELLVPKGDTYTARFVSLSENEVVKQIPMPNKPFITAEFKLIHTPPWEKSFVLNGVVFDTDKWDLKPESYPNLENLLEYMTLKKTARIRLEGHTDNVGNDAANQVLSRHRAEAVRQYLINKGIAASRMEAKGFGESKPVASNDTEEGRQTNRRTVVTILSR